MSNKFKEGDKVVAYHGMSKLKGVISSCGANDICYVSFPGDPAPIAYYEQQIRKLKPARYFWLKRKVFWSGDIQYTCSETEQTDKGWFKVRKVK